MPAAFRTLSLPLLACLLTLGLTAFAWQQQHSLAEQELRARFDAQVGETTLRLQQQLDRLAPSWPLGAHGVAMLSAWASDEAQSWVRASLHILRSWRRQQLDLCHRRLGWTCRASVTPFYLARWGRWDDPAQAQEDPAHPVRLLPELRTLGLKLRDCSSMGLPGWVRVSVQAPPSQQALSQLWRQVIGESSFVPTVRQSGFQSLSTY